MSSKFNYVVCSIEESHDLYDLTIDELQGSLLVHEQKMTQQDKEEQFLKVSTDYNHSSNRADKGRGKSRGHNDQRQQSKYEDNQVYDSNGKGRGQGSDHSTVYISRSTNKSNVGCFRCYMYGHYQSECWTNLNKENGEKSNFAEKQEEVISLLMASHAKEENQQNILSRYGM